MRVRRHLYGFFFFWNINFKKTKSILHAQQTHTKKQTVALYLPCKGSTYWPRKKAACRWWCDERNDAASTALVAAKATAVTADSLIRLICFIVREQKQGWQLFRNLSNGRNGNKSTTTADTTASSISTAPHPIGGKKNEAHPFLADVTFARPIKTHFLLKGDVSFVTCFIPSWLT